MNICKRQKLAVPATVMPGDTIAVTFHEFDPVMGETTHRTLVDDVITKAATYDEAAIVDGEIDGRSFLGGIVIEAP